MTGAAITQTSSVSGKPGLPTCRGGPFDSGHHMAEENPGELVRILRAFLSNA